MIIDFHTHLRNSIFGYGQTPSQLIKDMDKYGIDKAVVCPVKPGNYHFGPENNYISRISQQYSDRFIGFCRVDPRQKDKAVKEIERCAEKLNLKGVFLHPWEETFPVNDEIVLPVVETAGKYKLPVMIAGGYLRVSRAWQIADLVRQFPQVNFIITSGGQINISGSNLMEAEVMIRENPNVIMETSGIYREDFIEEIVEKYGKERVVFGSNSPEYHLGLEVKRAQWAHLSKDKIAAISAGNAARLLDLKI
jgi:predicted TIM-barrel fold metal-dependent hydrolase